MEILVRLVLKQRHAASDSKDTKKKVHPCSLVVIRSGHLVLNYIQYNATTKKISLNIALFVFGGK